MADDIYLKRTLNVVEDQGLVALDCIGWEDPLGGMGLRVFFKSGTSYDPFDPKPRQGCAKFSEARLINGGPMFIGGAEAPSKHIKMALKDGELKLPVQAPETDLFEDLNVCIAERNGESIEVIEDWLRYHVAGHGLQAVLLLDREKPNNEKGFERKFKALSGEVGLTRLVHVKSKVPLGALDLPPADHPFNAPDAPGKDRMDDLPTDPQTAPLADLALYEWAIFAASLTTHGPTGGGACRRRGWGRTRCGGSCASSTPPRKKMKLQAFGGRWPFAIPNARLRNWPPRPP